MILTAKQCKWLIANVAENTEQFIFVGAGKATKDEIEELREIDDFCFYANGYHLIANYKELNEDR